MRDARHEGEVNHATPLHKDAKVCKVGREPQFSL